ncbi:hypothetical protein ES708_32946 [subsurface metagenome]
MKIHTKIAWILALIATIAIFFGTFAQFPTTNIFRILGQLCGSAVIGLIVFGISFGIGGLIAGITKR